MNHDAAAAVLGHYEKAMTEFGAILQVLERECPPDEYARHSLAVAHLMGRALDFAGPIHLEHPDLDVNRITVRDAAPAPQPQAEPSVPAGTPEEKLGLLRTLALDYPPGERELRTTNADLHALCFRELAAAGVLAERLPREEPRAAAESAGLILDALTRMAGFIVLLEERPPRTAHGDHDEH